MSSNFNQEFDGDDDQFQSSVALAAHSPNESINGGGVRADGSTVSAAATTTIAASSKRKRNLPGHPDPDAEVVSLSPRTLMATNRYVCEVCHKGFQRDQNLQLHRRGHNLPWKLKTRPNNNNGSQGPVKKRVYVCPEPNCVHHDPSRALGDLTGIKKHYCRKHGEKKWKCDKCSKRYAVQSDWKAHSKICGTREYRCDCGTIFSRKDSFVTHRAFCDALTEENRNLSTNATGSGMLQNQSLSFPNYPNTNTNIISHLSNINSHENVENNPLKTLALNPHGMMMTPSYNLESSANNNSTLLATGSAFTSATALLQKAAEMGARISDSTIAPILLKGFTGYNSSSLVMNNINNNSSSNSVEEGRHTNYPRTVGSGLYVGNLEVPFEKIMGMNREGPNNNVTQVVMGGSEKLTVDFLGVAAGDNNQTSYNERKRIRYGDGDNMVGLDYLKSHEDQEYRHHQSMHELQSEW